MAAPYGIPPELEEKIKNTAAQSGVSASDYDARQSEFAVGATYPRSYAQHWVGYATAPSGAIRYANGVIADPETGIDGEVVFPPGDPTVAGSRAWLRDIQDRWSDEQITKWRQRLISFGYDVEAKGGIDQNFLDGLRLTTRGAISTLARPSLWTPRRPGGRCCRSRSGRGAQRHSQPVPARLRRRPDG